MIVNCKIIQIDDEVAIQKADGTLLRKQNVWLTPCDEREKASWMTVAPLWNEKIDRFIEAGYQAGTVVPVEINPGYKPTTMRSGERIIMNSVNVNILYDEQQC